MRPRWLEGRYSEGRECLRGLIPTPGVPVAAAILHGLSPEELNRSESASRRGFDTVTGAAHDFPNSGSPRMKTSTSRNYKEAPQIA